jgi:hypothetical protein
MFEETDSVLYTKLVPSKIKSFFAISLQNLEFPLQNSYCDHRNFDSVNHPLEYIHVTTVNRKNPVNCDVTHPFDNYSVKAHTDRTRFGNAT